MAGRPSACFVLLAVTKRLFLEEVNVEAADQEIVTIQLLCIENKLKITKDQNRLIRDQFALGAIARSVYYAIATQYYFGISFCLPLLL